MVADMTKSPRVITGSPSTARKTVPQSSQSPSKIPSEIPPETQELLKKFPNTVITADIQSGEYPNTEDKLARGKNIYTAPGYEWDGAIGYKTKKLELEKVQGIFKLE
jgi:hypothetical protein